MNPKLSRFEAEIQSYECTKEYNDSLYKRFTVETEKDSQLWEHREYIEREKLGFGDRALHFMWLIILEDLTMIAENPIKLLEIGVYKGQIISLWTLLGMRLKANLEIHCITPLEGNPNTNSWIVSKIKSIFSKKYRESIRSGNFYKPDDYLTIIKSLFLKFNLDFDKVNLSQGYSTSPEITSKFNDLCFDLIYIDGDHTFDGVASDIQNYAPLIRSGGILVMDDASVNIPGGEGIYWKGHKSVSDACEIIPKLGFINILNVGHNRVYRKL